MFYTPFISGLWMKILFLGRFWHIEPKMWSKRFQHYAYSYLFPSTMIKCVVAKLYPLSRSPLLVTYIVGRYGRYVLLHKYPLDCQTCQKNEIRGTWVKETLTKSKISTMFIGLQPLFRKKKIRFDYIFSDTIHLDTLRTVKLVH